VALSLALLTGPSVVWGQDQPAAGQAPDRPAAVSESGPGDGAPEAAWAEPRRYGEMFERTAKRLDLQTEKGPVLEEKPPRKPFKFDKRILIGLASVLGLTLIFLIVRALIKRRRNRVNEDASAAATDRTGLDTAALIDTGRKADLLAGKGLIVEAMHAILLDTIEELRRQKNLTFLSSLTSREIVYSLNLGGPATQCLAEIVNAVEPTWFGEIKPDLDQYRSLKLIFDRFMGLLTVPDGA
jgi:hypothetical protein